MLWHGCSKKKLLHKKNATCHRKSACMRANIKFTQYTVREKNITYEVHLRKAHSLALIYSVCLTLQKNGDFTCKLMHCFHFGKQPLWPNDWQIFFVANDIIGFIANQLGCATFKLRPQRLSDD